MSSNQSDDTQPSRQPDDLGETRPSPIEPDDPGATRPSQVEAFSSGTTLPRRQSLRKPTPPDKPRVVLNVLKLLIPAILIILLMVSISGIFGWNSGLRESNLRSTAEASSYMQEQYILAEQDLITGELGFALQRYDYIFSQDPLFLDVAERRTELMMILNITATPTPLPATITPTATLDPRPSEELFSQALNLINSLNWDLAIEMLSAMRNADATYRFVEVDGMFYLALRNRGIEKILNQGNLEGGLYDFALAEGFGPLDSEANNYRVWARLYLMGNSFWLAYPDIAAYYYGQVAGAAPNLMDGSGMTAFFRYWMSLQHYADQLAGEEAWCEASEQYQLVLAARSEQGIFPTATYALEQCTILTPSVTPTGLLTTTLTVTPTTTIGITYTPPPTGSVSLTPTPTATGLGAPTPTGTGTSTLTPPPTDTPPPTSTNPPTSTAAP
ncbi:MAG: hypothetical protein FVQ83_09685 [Chloroflexi bacterium]|nr:hypothetical protein [Chloroflexota bacterium]